MLTRTKLLLIGLFFATGVLFTTAEVNANPTGVPVPPAPTSCTTTNWLISAVLGPGGEFPQTEPCVNNVGKTCHLYKYNVASRVGTATPDHIAFAVSADQDLDRAGPSAFVAVPGAGDSTTGFLANAQHEYPVRVNPTPNVPAEISIVGLSSSRISTVLVKKGKTLESCLIAGPGVSGDTFQPVFQEQLAVVAGGKCNAHLIFDSTGNLVSVTTDPPCVSANPDVVIVNGKPLQNNTSPSGITFGDNTTTCYGPPKPRTPACICTAEPCP